MVVAMFGWGASWPIAKFLSGYINESEFVVYRYFITALTTIPVILWFKLSFKIGTREFWIILIASLCIIIYTKLFFLGTKYSSAGFGAALVTTLMPIIIYIISIFLKQKQSTFVDYIALLIGAFGVTIMLEVWKFNMDDVLNTANIYLIGAALAWSSMSIVSSYSKQLHPIVFSFWVYVFATTIDAILFAPEISYNLDLGNVFWFNIIVVSIFSTTFATTVYFMSIKQLGAKITSSFTYLVPFFAISLSVMFLDEVLKITTIIGVIITIISLKILNR